MMHGQPHIKCLIIIDARYKHEDCLSSLLVSLIDLSVHSTDIL